MTTVFNSAVLMPLIVFNDGFGIFNGGFITATKSQISSSDTNTTLLKQGSIGFPIAYDFSAYGLAQYLIMYIIHGYCYIMLLLL